MSGIAHLARRGMLAAIAALGFASLTAADAAAQANWPERPVRLLVPFGAGGAIDTLSRHMGNSFQQFANGHPLVVENRTGAGGTIAGGLVAREKPDGYTLMTADIGPNTTAHALIANLPYNPPTAFTPIIHLVNLPALILVRPQLPFNSLQDFVAAARKDPGKYTYASAGLGNWTHLFMAYFASEAKIDIVNVLYRSGAEMLTALLKGEADTAFITVSTSAGQVREGKIRPLAMGSVAPVAQMPGVPPIAQTIQGFDVSVWHGIVGPAGMDPALVRRINGIFNQILSVPAVRQALQEQQAATIVGGTPEQFAAHIRREVERWPNVVKTAGIKPE